MLCCWSMVVYGQQSSLIPFEKKSKYGLQDAGGKVVVDAIFDIKPISCKGGYWIVSKGGVVKTKPYFSYTGGEWALLDSAGNFLVNFQPNIITEYITSDYFYILGRPPLGLFQIETPDKKYGIIDKTGKQILPAECGFIKLDGRREAFAKYGFIPYSINGKYGVVKLNGEEVLKPEFDCIGKFKENNDATKAVAIYKNGKCGLLYTDGTFLPPLYDALWKYNITTKNKEILVQNKMQNCDWWNDMTFGRFIFAVDGSKEIVMTNDGVEIEPEAAMNAVAVDGNYIMVAKDNKWGVYSITDKSMMIPYSYDYIENKKRSLNCVAFIVKKNGKYFIVDENDKQLTSAGFEKQLHTESGYNYNISWGLCNGICDSVYYVNDECRVVAEKVIKEKRPEYSQSPFANEINQIAEDINKRLQQLKQEKCSCCNGTGKDRNTATTYKTCFKCSGKGYTVWNNREWNSATGNQYSQQAGKCDRCGGTGKEVDTETALPCSCCKGSGIRGY